MTGIDKSFPGVRALQDVDLTLAGGEVLAVVGENGAGKSTLIKVLSGAHRLDRGTIRIDGRPTRITCPEDAQQAGIAVIYQEFNLVPALSARENIFLGQERSRYGFIRRRGEYEQAERLFQRIGVPLDPELPCRALTVAQQQVVEIAKALSLDARIIVMDEPSATLTPQEVERLMQVIRELKADGLSTIYISHRLEEVFDIADRVMVMRDGRRVATRPVDQMTRETMIEMMVGRKLDHEFPRRSGQPGPPRLVVENLHCGGKVRDVCLTVRRGEVLGLTGLVGAGRTETARAIAGVDRRQQGRICLDGRQLRIRDPRDAIAAGICLLSEDRKAEGLVLNHSVRDNFSLPNLTRFSSWGFVRQRMENKQLSQYVDSLRIKISHPEQPVRNLSGGNQQKVVLAKWLEHHCDVIIFDEPTRGIDVGAKYEIYLLINQLADQGKAILLISSELPEVLGMSDRILVMHNGRITGELADVGATSQEDIMNLAVG